MCSVVLIALQLKGKDGEQSVGRISKHWSGFLKEALTDTDNFNVQFPQDLDVKMKAVLMGACFLIVCADSLFISLSLSMPQILFLYPCCPSLNFILCRLCRISCSLRRSGRPISAAPCFHKRGKTTAREEGLSPVMQSLFFSLFFSSFVHQILAKHYYIHSLDTDQREPVNP